MAKENKVKKEIDGLYNKIAPLQQRIETLKEEELLKVQLPRIRKMVGLCLYSTYQPNKSYYAKVIDFVETKNTAQFILEICHITEQGNPTLQLDNVSPYLNKEWWDSEFPVSGYAVCSKEEYEDFKGKVLSELTTQKLLRAFVKKSKY